MNLVNQEVKSSQFHIEKGYMEVKDNVAFEKIFEACNCFGHSYKGFQRAGTRHPHRGDVMLWFPKLYKNNQWDNTYADKENLIFEKPADSSKVKEHLEYHLNSDIQRRIVFAREKDAAGFFHYRFKGEYLLDFSLSAKQGHAMWRRVREKVRTFPPKELSGTK